MVGTFPERISPSSRTCSKSPKIANSHYDWSCLMSFHRCFSGFLFATMTFAAQSSKGRDPFDQAQRMLHVPNVLEIIAHETFSRTPGDSSRILVVDARNISARKIRGYVVDVRFRKSSHIIFAHHAQAMIMTSPGGQPRYLLPGEVESSSKPIAIPLPRTPKSISYSLILDLVEFDDGGHWGAATLPESEYLIRFFSTLDRLAKQSGK